VSDKYEAYIERNAAPPSALASRSVWKHTRTGRHYGLTGVKAPVNPEHKLSTTRDLRESHLNRTVQRASVLFPVSDDGHIDNENFRIVNVQDPVDEQDVVTKSYADSVANWRAPGSAIGSIHIWGDPGADVEFPPGWDRQSLHSDSSQPDKLAWAVNAANIDGNDRYGFGVDGNR